MPFFIRPIHVSNNVVTRRFKKMFPSTFAIRPREGEGAREETQSFDITLPSGTGPESWRNILIVPDIGVYCGDRVLTTFSIQVNEIIGNIINSYILVEIRDRSGEKHIYGKDIYADNMFDSHVISITTKMEGGQVRLLVMNAENKPNYPIRFVFDVTTTYNVNYLGGYRVI